MGLTLDALADDWELVIETAAEVLQEATLPQDRFEWLREQSTAELESLFDQPEAVAAWAFLDQLYRPHALGRPTLGTAEGLGTLQREDCARHLHAALARGGVLSMAGAIDEEKATAKMRECFGPERARRSALEPVPEPLGSGERRRIVATGGTDQAHLYLGHLTVRRSDPDLAALEVLSVLLGAGDGLAGRIPQRIREQDGLAYSVQVSAVAGAGLDPGRFMVYVGTAQDTVERAEVAVLDELGRLLEGGATEHEVTDAKGYLLAREPFRRETGRQWADLLIEAGFYEQPYDSVEWVRRRIEAVDLEAVNAAMRRHLDLDRLVITVGVPKPRPIRSRHR